MGTQVALWQPRSLATAPSLCSESCVTVARRAARRLEWDRCRRLVGVFVFRDAQPDAVAVLPEKQASSESIVGAAQPKLTEWQQLPGVGVLPFVVRMRAKQLKVSQKLEERK